MRINSVTIVGGGSSGWMTAAALSKSFPDLKVSLVEDPNTPTIGVGESTLSHFNEFLHMIGLTNDSDWMPYCNATYKNGAVLKGFSDFVEKLHFPLGAFNLQTSPDFSIWTELNKRFPDRAPASQVANFFLPNTYLVDANKQTDNKEGTFPRFNFFYDVAYHLDTFAFGNYLKNYVCTNVDYIPGKVVRKGKYTIYLDDGSSVTSDLFIDCTGFKSVLSKSPRIDYNEILLNDCAYVTSIPYSDPETQLTNRTTATAVSSGWIWEIPLWDRISIGYCYSSKFIKPYNAIHELKSHCKKQYGVTPKEFKSVPFKSGKRLEAWVDNVLSIGLSYSFIEPLESTGLLTTHLSISYLINLLSNRDRYVNKMDIDGYNSVMSAEVDHYADFISYHYGMSTRNDTAYWREATECMSYNGSRDDIWNNLLRDGGFSTNGSNFLLAVQNGYNPLNRSSQFSIHKVDTWDSEYERIENNAKQWYNQYNQTIERVNSLPSSYQFLKQNVYDVTV